MDLLTTSNRRDFLKRTSSYISLGIFAGILPQLVSSCSNSTSANETSPVDINLNGYPSLAEINGWEKIIIEGKNNGKPIIVIRTGDATFTILSSICGHQGCVVGNPDMQYQSISCPCHGSKYTLTGNIINGPTTKPLKNFTYTFNQSKNVLTINLN